MQSEIFARREWELEDGEARHSESPDTFWIPPLEQRRTLKPGQLVKLIFRASVEDANDPSAVTVERMWVIVNACEDTNYVGTLDNDSRVSPILQSGLQVRFEPRHVIQIAGS